MNIGVLLCWIGLASDVGHKCAFVVFLGFETLLGIYQAEYRHSRRHLTVRIDYLFQRFRCLVDMWAPLWI